MDSLNLALFLAAAFLGGMTSGLSGFAMGLVVSGVWLHIIAPDQNALLIVLCGLVTQGSGIWRVRKSIEWRAVAPFIIGSALGVPAGTALLKTADQSTIRFSIGFLLMVFSLYSLFRPAIEAGSGRRAARAWRRRCQRPDRRTHRAGRHRRHDLVASCSGGAKDAQRAIFQPVMFSTFADDRDLARRGRRVHHRDAEALCVRACPLWLPASGSASSSMASSTMPASARSSCRCCCSSGLSLIVPIR